MISQHDDTRALPIPLMQPRAGLPGMWKVEAKKIKARRFTSARK
jgi:hypothetical protein